MTTQCPDNTSIPSDASLWYGHSNYWILDYNTVHHNGEWRELKAKLDSLREGQTVGCMVSREGELHVYIDGVDKGIVWTGLPTHKPFWGVADVYGCTKKIQLVSGEWLLSIAVSHVPHPLHHLPVFTPSLLSAFCSSSFLTLSESVPAAIPESVLLYRHLQSKLSITKTQKPPTIRHREDQVSNPQATPPHQTSSGTANDTNTVLHLQNAYLQQDEDRLKQEVICLQENNARLKQNNQEEVTHLQQDIARHQQTVTHLQLDHHQEVTRLQQEITCLQEKNACLKENHQQEVIRLQQVTRQLQSRLDQQPKLGSDTDISFWVVSHNEVRSTGQVLGEGGWGRVVIGSFRGQDVAMKQLHSIISSSDYYRDLLRREISLMAKVRHPNLLLFMAAVLDSPSNTPIIITELMDTNLRQAYHNAQLTNNGVRLSILRDVSAALNYLHLQPNPIIHRDVSSANVLLLALPNNKWRGKLSDFGSANLVQHASTPGPGAVIYTAPEVFRGEQQSTKMDTFSFGKLLCEVFTNRLPDPEAFPSMLQSITKDWPLMHQLISSCVQQDPNKRPAMSYIVGQLNLFTKQK